MFTFREVAGFVLFRSGLKRVLTENSCTCSTKSIVKVPKPSKHQKIQRTYGQPSATTHPHIIKDGEVVPGISAVELQERRNRLMEKIYKYSFSDDQSKNQHHIIVIPSASKVFMSQKIPYVFRQNSDFLYLSGCLEPDSALVLTGANGQQHISTLFVQKHDQQSELWNGPRTSVEAAPTFFGVDNALPFEDLEVFLHSFTRTHRSFKLWYDFMNPVHSEIHKMLNKFISKIWNKMWESPYSFIQQLRLFKSASESALMEASCKIASDSFVTTIKSSYPGISEHNLYARMDYECRVRGAEHLAYPPVVAGGERANIIHYINNNQIIKEGDMVLMDAGCEYHGYSSDITRTWPISGKFSNLQRDLYEVVLCVQSDLIHQCSFSPPLDDLFMLMCNNLGRRLQEIGLIPKRYSGKELSDAAYKYCPHHVSHYLGMDVHDTTLISRSIKIEPGMMFTIEPGVYVNPRNELAPPEFHGFGIRIEDDVLMTESGPVVLSDPCPKTVEEMEALAAASPLDI